MCTFQVYFRSTSLLTRWTNCDLFIWPRASRFSWVGNHRLSFVLLKRVWESAPTEAEGLSACKKHSLSRRTASTERAHTLRMAAWPPGAPPLPHQQAEAPREKQSRRGAEPAFPHGPPNLTPLAHGPAGLAPHKDPPSARFPTGPPEPGGAARSTYHSSHDLPAPPRPQRGGGRSCTLLYTTLPPALHTPVPATYLPV